MRTPRVFCPQPLTANSEIILEKEIAHYLGRVLRLKEGAQIILFDGRGGEYLAQLNAIQKSNILATLGAHHFPATDPSLNIHLVQGISRGERMQYVIQKAVELGATRLTPVFSDYCEVKLSGERADKRQDHWQSHANSACEQCGRTRLMEIDQPVKLNEWLNSQPQLDSNQVRITLDPYADTPLQQIHTTPNHVTLLIGPEGGLSENEVLHAKESGFTGIRLGPRILRTETATAAALTAINLTWGDFR